MATPDTNQTHAFPRRGRAACSNTTGRYETEKREAFDDGWDEPPGDEKRRMLIKTTVQNETPRKIINYVESPFVSFDRSINPYRGCEHGCVYCFARSTHAHYGLSPGLDFETRLFAKPNAALLLRRELSARQYQPNTIAIGTNTDPYQPIERRHRIIRQILETIVAFRHPVSILTKSSLIERDIDVLSELVPFDAVKAMVSVTTLEPKLARAMEPRASAPHKRLEAVSALAKAGIPTGVMVSPMIPGLNDCELDRLLAAAKDAGAQFVGTSIIRLPMEVAPIFREWLDATQQDKASKVMRQIREMNGGRDYDPKWSRASEPRSVMAKLIRKRFKAAARRLELSTDIPALSAKAFRKPVEKGDQLSLFGESCAQ